MSNVNDRLNAAIKKISGSSDAVSDIEAQLRNIRTDAPLDPYRKTNWLELMKTVKQGDSSKQMIDQLTANLTNLQPSKSRIDAYNNMRALKRKMPIIRRALMIFVDNILSPDDITKRSIQVVVNDDKVKDANEQYTEVIKSFKDILKQLEIEDKADDIIFNTLLDGDRFTEIVDSKQELKRIALKNNIIIKDHTIKEVRKSLIQEVVFTNQLLHKDNPSVYNKSNRNNFKLVFETTLPIGETINLNITKDGKPVNDDSDTKESKKLTISDLMVQEHDPRNIVILSSRKWIMGYLFIDAKIDYSYGLAPSSISTYMNKKTNDLQYEDKVSDELVKNLFDKIAAYLKDKNIDDIPKNLYTTLINILQTNKYNLTGLNVRFIPTSNMVHFKNPSDDNFPYGESYLTDLAFVLNMYLTRMIASTIYKVARAGKHLMVSVEVAGSRDAKGRIENVKRSMNSREFTSEDLASTELLPSIISTLENIYIPMVDGKKFMEIEPLELGSFSDRDEDDQSLLKNILTGIEIPPSLLGVEEFNSTKSTLSQESIVFARSIVRLQKLFTKYFTELVRKIYVVLNPDGNHELYLDVMATFMPPRGIISESLGNIYQQIHEIYENLKDMGVPLEVIQSKFLSDFDWESYKVKQLEEEKEKLNSEDDESGGFGGEEEGGGGEFGL